MLKHTWPWMVLIIVIVTGMLLPVSPLFRPVPSDDSSVFLYVGERILEGEIPYQDAWDHKQPLTYFLFALGQIITPHSLWGIWGIQAIIFCTAGIASFLLLSAVAGRPASALAVSLGMLSLYPVLWGYSLEELALAFQCAALFAFARYIGSGSRRAQLSLIFAVGVLTALAFFLKQNLVAVGLAAGVYLAFELLLRRSTSRLADLAGLAAGFLLVAGLVMAYFWLAGAIDDYLSAAFTFNLSYAALGPLERTIAALDALEFMGSIPALWLACILWLACALVALFQSGPFLGRLICKRAFRPASLGLGAALAGLSLAGELAGGQPGLGFVQKSAIVAGGLLAGAGLLISSRLRDRLSAALVSMPVLPESGQPLRVRLFYLAALLFPINLALIALSGRNYIYYFITFLPFYLLALGLVGDLLRDAFTGAASRRVGAVLLFSASVALVYNPALLLVNLYRQQPNPPLPPVIDYITAHTRPEDPIYAWGKGSTYVYFLSQRQTTTRFFYQAAVWQEPYNAMVGAASQIQNDLEKQPPVLILIQAGLPEGNTSACPLAAGETPNSEEAIFRFVCDRYVLSDAVDDFLIFSLKEGS